MVSQQEQTNDNNNHTSALMSVALPRQKNLSTLRGKVITRSQLSSLHTRDSSKPSNPNHSSSISGADST